MSHDLKTPLTSIINYADLICEETSVESNARTAGEGTGETADTRVCCPDISKIAEYAQVLLRQSRRLKKLLEDLLEASKATTGNLEVNLEPCEVGVLLSQAVGEYQQRMEEKQPYAGTCRPARTSPPAPPRRCPADTWTCSGR